MAFLITKKIIISSFFYCFYFFFFILNTSNLLADQNFFKKELRDPSPQLINFTKDSSITPNQILFLAKQGRVSQAIDSYSEYKKSIKKHDFFLLKKIAFENLKQGIYQNNNPESFLLALFGAGLSGSDLSLPLLREGLETNSQEIQLMTLSFLSQYYDNQADELMLQALRSPFLMTSMEAAFYLAQKQKLELLSFLFSLYYKVPPELHIIFPQLFILYDNPKTNLLIKHLLNHPKEEVRVETLLQCALHKRDDFLPQIRSMSKHMSIPIQEACAKSLGLLKDEKSISRLKQLVKSSFPSVKLATSNALNSLEDQNLEWDNLIFEEMHKKNPFAINLLDPSSNKKALKLLEQLLTDSNQDLSFSAMLTLLEKKQPSCLPFVKKFLISPIQEALFLPFHSAGKSLQSYKSQLYSTKAYNQMPHLQGYSTHLKEYLLKQSRELPEKYFLSLARFLLEKEQLDLIPLLVLLLEDLQTPKAKSLLKEFQEKPGSPLIRSYCNLALYRIDGLDINKKKLYLWISQKKQFPLIRLRSFLPRKARLTQDPYVLSPEESSRLLIESFEALVQNQSEDAIEILLQSIKNENRNNSYVLSGLLIRALL